MRIVNLSLNDFNTFANNHTLRNYYQTSEYAKVMENKGYTYDYIGYMDNSNNLVAASLILKKKIGTFAKYVYAPKGVLIDYYDDELLKMFFKDLASFYKLKGFSFLKINPEIIIGEIDSKNNFNVNYNQNVGIIDSLKNIGFKRRREIYPLDFIYPRIGAFINLKEFSISDELKNIIEISNQNGLSIEAADAKDIDILYDIAKNRTNEDISYYKNILSMFDKGQSELFLVKIDFEKCLINARTRYEEELNNNNYYNELIQTDATEENIIKKMQSDKDLLKYKDEVVIATEGLKLNKNKYIGGAVIVKYQNRVSVVLDAFEKESFFSEYYLYNYFIETFKDSYEFLDLFGLASNFDYDSKYVSFNKPKLDFNPNIYEFIGEFDMVLSELLFKKIQSKSLLSKEFLPSHRFEDR